MTRTALNRESAILFFKIYHDCTLELRESINSVAWKAGGVFLAALLIVLLAFCVTAYYIRDLRVENGNLKEKLVNASIEYMSTRNKIEALDNKLKLLEQRHRVEMEELQDTTDQLKRDTQLCESEENG